MSSWRYGISKIAFGDGEKYALVEKYTLHGGEQIETAGAISFEGDDPQEVIRSLERALLDLKAEAERGK